MLCSKFFKEEKLYSPEFSDIYIYMAVCYWHRVKFLLYCEEFRT